MIVTDKETWLQWMLEARGVRTPCPRCGGVGNYTYASTATWRGGVTGIERRTLDVCDACWGTGCAERIGCDLRAMEAAEAKKIRDGARALLRKLLGYDMPKVFRAVSLEIADGLDALPRKGRLRHTLFDNCAKRLAAILREDPPSEGSVE